MSMEFWGLMKARNRFLLPLLVALAVFAGGKIITGAVQDLYRSGPEFIYPGPF